jgi:hypothetical protein
MPIPSGVLRLLHTRLALPATLAVLIALTARPAGAGTVSGGAGFDYQTGPNAQSYRSALLFASAERDLGDLTLAAIRYGDSRVGPGVGGFANAGVAVTPRLRVRAVGLRAVGDQTYRAWRWRLGPEIHTASDLTLGVYYLRLTDNAGESLSSAGAELGAPLARNVTGQIGSSYGTWNSAATTAQASLSGTWQPLPRVLLLGEVDVGRNLTATTAAGPSGGGALGGLPLPGGMGRGNRGSASGGGSEISSAGQIGVRFVLP